jgi:hypothetical protein
VNRAIKAAVRRFYLATGTDAEKADRMARRYSGYSGRVGQILSAKEAGANDSDVAATTRHKSLQRPSARVGSQAIVGMLQFRRASAADDQ